MSKENKKIPTPSEAATIGDAIRDAVDKKAEVNAAKAEAAAAELKAKKPPYSVAGGKAITCKKGIIGSGEEVKPEYFDNDGDLASLIKREIVIKN